jgi:hypothetical protein
VKTAHPKYAVHPGVQMVVTWVNTLKAKTGRSLGLSMGKDVKVCPCSTIVPLYRNHVFAQIKPSARTRIEFGLALGDTKGSGRLIETGGYAKKDRITHRVEITALGDITGPVKKWLRTAYDRDAK